MGNQNTLISLLFQDASPSHSEYLNIAEGIITSKLQLVLDDDSKDQLSLDPEKAGDRILKLFNVISPRKISKKVADQLSSCLLLPIISAAHEIGNLEIVTKILISGISVVSGCSITILQQLAKAISETDVLLERISTDQNGHWVMKTFVEKFGKGVLDSDVLYSFTYRLMMLCDSCSHGHSTKILSEKWQELQRLRVFLAQLHSEFEARENERIREIPALSNLKPLGKDNKKGYKARTEDPSRLPNIPPNISRSLALFQVPEPRSLRALDTVISNLETETTLSILKSIMESFPCRPCNDVACGSVRLQEMLRTNTDEMKLIDTSFDSEIFGQRVGDWKVLLSSQAVKELKNLTRSGISELLESKLRKLAKGDWAGGKMTSPAGSKSQRQHMNVPVLQAKCTRKISILWQIDVGIYDDLDHVRQLVKVWQIVDHGELPHAIDQIIRLQKAHEPFLCNLYEDPIRNLDGICLPRQFESVDDQQLSPPTRYDGDIQKMEKGFIEMSNKFYSLTEPLLKSLFSDLAAEFPFELSKEELRIITHIKTSSLILGRSGTGKTTCIVFKILSRFKARNYPLNETPIRQVLLTKSNYLATKLKTYTHDLFMSQLSDTVSQDFFSEEGKVLDAEEDTTKQDTIFSTNKTAFPLVCTFDEFLKLLENTVKMADRKNFSDGVSHRSRANQGLGLLEHRVIDFHVFKAEYWVRFPKNLTRNVSVDLIFAEIMGVLKGSISSADTLNPLSREQYFKTSCRLAPAFTTDSERERVYDIYEIYEKMKMERGEIDQVDRVIALLGSIMSNQGFCDQLGQAFEEVYVDEVQDLRCLDIVLLLSTIRNARGIHLAGDTAQCISNDSTFRFAEMKDLFYQRYVSTSRTTNQEDLARPTQFTLAKNYRSHQGILTVASLVMQMLWNGFPYTVDKLSPETSQVAGPRPMVFVGFDADILSSRMIGLVNLDDRLSDFGAEQAIIVRDGEAKAKLQSSIGDIALILTILESKGMEFDDVLMYNFFSDGGHDSSYRRLHLLLDKDKNFDAKKDAVLCSELKHLYVAVTRARKQLWLLESSKESAEPVLKLFEINGEEPMVEIVRPTDENVAEKVKILRAGASIDPKRWAERGNHFLDQKNFNDALFCFTKAGDKQGSTTAKAYSSEQEARTYKALGDNDGFVKSSENAVTLFLEVQLTSNASKCLENMKAFERAAVLWFDLKKYEKAGELFQLAKLFEEAFNCYHVNHSYDKAAEALHVGGLYDQLITYLNLNSDRLDPVLCQRYIRLCNLLLKQGRVPLQLRARCINLLGSDQRKEQFLKDFEMIEHLVDLYRTQRRYLELYRILVEDGQLRSAFECIVLYNLYDSIPEHDIETAFNFLQAELFLQGKECEPESLLVSGKWKKTAPPFLLSASAAWIAASSILSSIKRHEIPGALKSVQNRVIKDWLCLFVVSFLPDFILGTNSIPCLPIEILKETARLVQGVSPEKSAFSSTSLMLCGIFTTPTQKEVYLSWSPMINSNEADNHISMGQSAMQRVLSKLSVAVSTFDDKARDLWTLNWPHPCIRFSSKGFCSFPSCKFPHKSVTTEWSFSMVNELLHISSVFSSMNRLYLGRFMDEAFQKNILGRRRHWLERLISEITYVSGFHQAASAINKSVSSLYSNNAYFMVAGNLEGLLFYRMDTELQERSKLASLMAQYHLSLNLGHDVHNRFMGALTRKIRHQNLFHYRPTNTQDSNTIGFNLQAVNCFRRVRVAVFMGDEASFRSNVRELLNFYGQSSIRDLAEFCAITTTFEFIASYLLLVRTRLQPAIFPWSWTILHLAAILRRRSLAQASISEQNEFNNTECLIDVVCCFCNLMRTVNIAISNDFRFSFGGRLLSPILLQRRNIEFVAIVALNLGVDKYPAIHWRETWNRTQEVFRMPMSPLPHFQPLNFQAFSEAFVPCYKAYNGKDRLLVLATGNERNPHTPIDRIIALGASWISHEEILAGNPCDDTWSSSSMDNTIAKDTEDTIGGNEFTENETLAIVTIQKFWKRYSSKIKAARNFSQSADGRIINSYLEMFATCIPKDQPAIPMIAVRAHLLTQGLELQNRLNTLGHSLQSLRKKLSAQLADEKIPTDQLEAVEADWVKLKQCLSDTQNIGDRWSRKKLGAQTWWLDSERLRGGLDKDVRRLKALQEDADRLSEKEM